MPSVPMLYVWTQPWDVGLSYSQGKSGQSPAVTGSALVAVPIQWQPPEAGTALTLPRPLLTFHEITGPDGARPTGFYDVRARQWSERTGSSSGWVAFDLPTELMPLETKRVEVTFKVTGAMGRLEISGFKDGAVRSIKSWDKPVGTLTWTIDDGSLVPLDNSGRFMFRIDAGIANAPLTSSSSPANPVSENPPGTESQPLPLAPASDPPDQQAPQGILTTYWQFEEVSARITVVAPPPETTTATAP